MKYQYLILTVSLLITAVPVQAEPPRPDGFFSFRKIIHPDRTYFKDLSDAEYASIDLGPQFYPFILDVWPHEPIGQTTFFHFKRPTYTSDASVRLQSYLLKNSKNPHALAMTYGYLSTCGNPVAADVVRPFLSSYKDPNLLADNLHCQALYNSQNPTTDIVPLIGHPQRRVRMQAVRLYALQPEANPKRLFKRLTVESDPAVRAELCKAAVRLRNKTDLSDWQPLLNGGQTEDLAIAMSAVLLMPQARSKQEQLAQLAETANEHVCFAMAQNCLPGMDPALAGQLLQILATNKYSGVRAASAEAIGRLRLKSRLPKLLKLAGDARPNVRRAAARSLRQFPVKSSFAQLVVLTGDADSPLAREAAKDSLVAIADRYPVDEELAPYIHTPNVDTRYNLCRILSGIGSSRHAKSLEQALRKEKRPINLAANIRALITAGAASAQPSILRYAKHESPIVRTAVAEAVGSFKLDAGHPVIVRYALTDRKQEPRLAAIQSMGLIGDNKFSQTLLTILKRTNYTDLKNPEFLTATDRAAACWSIARLPDAGEATYARMVKHVTTPVVRYPLAPPAFDGSEVRISVPWAFATIAKRNNDTKMANLAEKMLGYLNNPSGDGGSVPVNNPMLYYIYQCRQFLAGKAMTRRRIEMGTFNFNLRRAKDSRY